MSQIQHATIEELDEKLEWVRDSPKDNGSLGMIVVRPSTNQRVSLSTCEVSPEGGVHGDGWATQCSKKLEDGRPDPDRRELSGPQHVEAAVRPGVKVSHPHHLTNLAV